jgi:tRNA 2-thiouridine synthesizing protein E
MTTLTTTSLLDSVQFDEGGYMVNAALWTPAIAVEIANREGITLTNRHWIVINFARQEYDRNGEAPTLRRITKQTDVDTKEIYQLFPGGPGKLAAKIAGLKKPTGCI